MSFYDPVPGGRICRKCGQVPKKHENSRCLIPMGAKRAKKSDISEEEIEIRLKKARGSRTMTDEEYEALRKRYDSEASAEEIHEEANTWNKMNIAPGTFRRTAQENFFPGDIIIKTWDEWLD